MTTTQGALSFKEQEMKKVPLTKGYDVTIDNEDYALLLSNRWSALELNSKNFKQVYAVRTIEKKKQYLHREIMKQILRSQNKSIKIMKNRFVVFNDSNTLNCTRKNLCLLPEKMKNRQRRSVKK